MVGESLAEARGIGPGDTLDLLGEAFTVKGTFARGTLADSELWIPLTDAQRLFRLGDEVSIYVVRGSKDLQSAIEAALPVEVTREGEGFVSFSRSLSSFVQVLRLVSAVMALAAVLGILTVMFTMVQSRRREIGVLRAVGFGRGSIVLYVLVQALAVALAGYLLALLSALGISAALNFEAVGVSVTPVLDGIVAGAALVWSLAIAALAAAYPAMLAAKINLADTLRAE